MAKRIMISFKETEKDIKLYDFLIALEDRSAEIKKVLRKEFIEQDQEQKEEKKDFFDF